MAAYDSKKNYVVYVADCTGERRAEYTDTAAEAAEHLATFQAKYVGRHCCVDVGRTDGERLTFDEREEIESLADKLKTKRAPLLDHDPSGRFFPDEPCEIDAAYDASARTVAR